MVGALVAFWLASRRPLDARVTAALDRVDDRLIGLTERIDAATARPVERAPSLAAIGSTIELAEVLQRTLAAAAALPAVDSSSISVQRANGAVETAVQGLDPEDATLFLTGPPDGGSFVSGLMSWDAESSVASRTGLVVPIGDRIGTLAVYSRHANVFDAEAVTLLATIARYAAPAIQNAFQYLDVKDLALTDARTGLGSQLAFDEALPRLFTTARRHGRPLTMIQVDLDDFGSINRRFSQDVGDEVLAEFGRRVWTTKRASDEAFRNSGGADEFFIILPDTSRSSARLLYERLAFEMSSRPFGEVPAVTMSSGLVEMRSDDTHETFKGRSGRLVQSAKERGKNQLCDDGEL